MMCLILGNGWFYPGGVAVHDGHNGIMVFGTNLFRPRAVLLGKFYIESCVKPFNRSFDHALQIAALYCGQITRSRGLMRDELSAVAIIFLKKQNIE